jgi:hypothetical protein
MSKSPRTRATDREVDALQHLLDDGFLPAMVIRKVPQSEIKAKLPEAYWTREVKALPLARSDGEKRMFYFITPETAELAERLVAEQRTVTRYTLCVYCSAIGPDVVHGRIVDFTKIIPAVREQTGWDVRESKHPGVFEVHEEVVSADIGAIERRLAEIDRVALALSLRNGLGFYVLEHSAHPIFVGEPLNIVVGLSVRLLSLPEVEAYNAIAELEGDQRRYAAALALREIYSQVTARTKLIIGWSAIEDLFPSAPDHLLSESAVVELIGLVERHSVLSVDHELRDRVTRIIQDPQFFAKQRRNERLAAQIAPLLGQTYEATYRSIREASSARGKFAHANPQDFDVREHVQFFERVLAAVLNSPQLLGEGEHRE